MNEERTVMLPVDDFVDYIKAKAFVEMLADMIYEDAYLSYNGESLRVGSSGENVMQMLKFYNYGRYRKELFFKQQEKRDKEDEEK